MSKKSNDNQRCFPNETMRLLHERSSCRSFFDKKIPQGLDIKGGISAIVTASPPKGKALNADMLEQANTILTNRVDKLGVSQASIQQQGTNSFLIQIPGAKGGEKVIQDFLQTGVLEFRPVIGTNKNGSPKLGPIAVSGDTLTSAQTSFDQLGKPEVTLAFNKEGTEKFAKITTELAKTQGQLAILLDGKIKSAPSVREPITDGRAVINNIGSIAEAKNLTIVLQTGALPVNLQIQESRFVGPTLGQDSLVAGLIAVLAGLAAVAVYLFIYYRGFGLVAWGALATFAIFFLGALSIIGNVFNLFALTLPGIAGIALSIGIAADTSILIFERIKEEVRGGKTLRSATPTAFWHAIGTSIDADLVTFVAAIFLYLFAIGPVRGFAFTLMLGIVLDIAVAFTFTRSAVLLLADWKPFRSSALTGLKGAEQA